MPGQVFTQTTFTACASDNFIGEFNIQWSMGEMSGINTKQVQNVIIVTEGFLQPSNYNLISTKQIAWIEEVKFFPDPVSDILNINFMPIEIKFPILVQLRNILGLLVFSNTYYKMLGPIELQVDMRAELPGVYIFSLGSGENFQSFKFIKQ